MVKTSYGNAESGLKTYGATCPLQIKSVLTGDEVKFAAFLTNFSQNFTSNWNTEEVYGRNDPIATFQGTKRTISLSFDVPSSSLSAAKDALASCDLLSKFMYPGFLGKQSTEPKARLIARPPLVKVKFANLISDGESDYLLGYLGALDWTSVLEMGMFEDGTTTKSLYPKVISLSFTLTVLHQKELGFGDDNKWLGKNLIG
jgi:hypothetical protein